MFPTDIPAICPDAFLKTKSRIASPRIVTHWTKQNLSNAIYKFFALFIFDTDYISIKLEQLKSISANHLVFYTSQKSAFRFVSLSSLDNFEIHSTFPTVAFDCMG